MSNNNNNKQVGFRETDPFAPPFSISYGASSGSGSGDFDVSTEAFVNLKQESFASERERRESVAADRLSMRLLACDDNDEEQQDRILRESLALDMASMLSPIELAAKKRQSIRAEKSAGGRFWIMVIVMVVGLGFLAVAYYVGAKVIRPPNQPLGPYQLVERQVSGCLLLLMSCFCFSPRLVNSTPHIHIHQQTTTCNVL